MNINLCESHLTLLQDIGTVLLPFMENDFCGCEDENCQCGVSDLDDLIVNLCRAWRDGKRLGLFSAYSAQEVKC